MNDCNELDNAENTDRMARASSQAAWAGPTLLPLTKTPLELRANPRRADDGF